MTILKTLAVTSLAAGLALPAFAQMATPTPKTFVMKAGASDKFEISEAKLMMSSKNPDIVSFATQMKTDHTKSTDMVKTAAKADGLMPAPPMLDAKQKHDLAALTAKHGKARDMLYVTQQKAAHADALALMQTYSTSGTARHLKDTAGQIVPVVQSHVDMLDKMSSM
jgi:putative membrane protein